MTSLNILQTRIRYGRTQYKNREGGQHFKALPVKPFFNESAINHSKTFYSVMQSDGNSFCGDFVSDRFNKTSRDGDNISDQI